MSGSDETLKIIGHLEALAILADANFPSNSDVRLSAEGKTAASISVPSYQLTAILKAARTAIEAQPS